MNFFYNVVEPLLNPLRNGHSINYLFTRDILKPTTMSLLLKKIILKIFIRGQPSNKGHNDSVLHCSHVSLQHWSSSLLCI